jgi:hypothetical protein
MHATRERISLRKNKAVNFYTTMHNVSNIDIGIIYQTRIHQDEVGKKPSKKIILHIPSKLHQFSVLTREKNASFNIQNLQQHIIVQKFKMKAKYILQNFVVSSHVTVQTFLLICIKVICQLRTEMIHLMLHVLTKLET